MAQQDLATSPLNVCRGSAARTGPAPESALGTLSECLKTGAMAESAEGATSPLPIGGGGAVKADPLS